MPSISDALRIQVTDRAIGLCEYCQTAQIIVVDMEVDHIIPQSVGGTTTLDSLCLACRGCNSFKQDFQIGVDPISKQEVALFNPRVQTWGEHLAWNETGTLILGLTATGRATIERLRMNPEGVVAARRVWVQAGWHPPHSGQFPSIG